MLDLTASSPDSPGHPIHVLVVDDDSSILRLWRRILRHERYRVSLFSRANEALQALREGDVDVAVTDICMPEMDGMRFLAEAKVIDREVPVIMMTAHVDVGRAVESIRRGAYDFLGKPFENTDAVELTVLRAAERHRLARRVRDLEAHEGLIKGFLGDSPPIRRVKELVQAVAGSQATVLVCGESGTGKELVARAIHENSPRKSKPLLTVNCSAFADTLLEEELFGHAKGAFTGADARKAGIFEAANGGTVFLDEIGDMSLPCQAKVLRTLQEGEVRPVGSTTTLKVDVRIIAATNVDLEQRCLEKRFRQDLYYRLNVVRIDVPPLRERQDDIPLLTAHFLHRYQEAAGKRLDGIRESTLELFARYHWPGNVRELKNLIERAVLLASANRKLSSSDFPVVRKATSSFPAVGAPIPSPAAVRLAPTVPAGRDEWDLDLPFNEAKTRLVEQFERGYLQRQIEKHGSITAAAEASGLDRSNFKRLLRRHGLLAAELPAGR